MIDTTNWIERLNRDFKRVTRMRGAFPNPYKFESPIMSANFEHNLIRDIVGEKLYHELCCELGGLQISFKKSNRSSVLFFFRQGSSVREIAYKMGVSEQFVRRVIGERLAKNQEKRLFDLK